MKNIGKEFQEFCQDSTPAPSHLWRKIENTLKTETETEIPSLTPALVVKILLLYVTASAAILLICPQFGVKIPFSDINVMKWVMHVAPALCDPYCGALFLGSSFVALRIGLKSPEWSLVKKHKLVVFSLMGLVSLFAFHLMSSNLKWSGAFMWLLGGLLATLLVSFIRLPGQISKAA